MAIAFRAESHVVGTGNSVTGTEPTGTTQNDVLIAMYLVDTASSTLGIPSGWTSLSSGTSLNTGNFRWNFCYVVRGASAPSLAFTHTGSVYRELFILSFSGVDNSSPIDAFTDGGTGTTNNTIDPPAVTAISSSAMALAIGIYWGGSNAGGYGAPAGYTIRTDNTAGNDGVMATKQLSASGSENPSAFTNAGSGLVDGWNATITLSPAANTSPAIIGTSVGGSNNSSNTLPTVTGGYQAGDLILAAMYTEPSNESTPTATYGTWVPPTGYTFLPLSPQNSNDTNLTSQNSSRCYCWYKWAIGTETSGTAIDATGGSTNWVSAAGVIVIRGAVNAAGTTSGTPYHEGTSGGSSTSAGNFPSLSLNLLGSNNLLIYLASNWNSTVAALSGWTETGGTECYWLYKSLASNGSTGAVQPTSTVNTDNLLTGALMSFRGTADPTSVTIAWVTA